MAHSLIMTEIRRCSHYVTSDFDLHNRMQEDFGGGNGAVSLSSVLGIPAHAAFEVLAGRLRADKNRLAFHFGYMPDEMDTGWRMLPMEDEPASPGPPMRWTPRLIGYLSSVLGNGAKAPTVRHMAWRMDTTEARLRRAMKLHRIEACNPD